jgi:xanthine dehydrogenase FAD-binding subunit
MVNHVIPKNYEEALRYLFDETYKVIAGGTDLMIQKRGTRETPPKFDSNMLYCFNLDELNYVKKEKNRVHIGSMTPLEVLLNHPDIPEIMKKIIGEMASPAIRNVATLSGNIANASPAGDSLVALYLMNAMIVLESLNGQRILPIEQFIAGPRQTVIAKNEIIKEIVIENTKFTKIQWTKVGGRRADAISKISCLCAVNIKEDKIVDFRIALGAVYKTVVRSKEIESKCIGMKVDDLKTSKETILSLYNDLIQPIDDQRSNQIYRKKVALNIIEKWITDL